MTSDPTPACYHIRLVQEIRDGKEVWTASHPALLGCHTIGGDPLEAVKGLGDVRQEWLGRAGAGGVTIPNPQDDPSYELILAKDHVLEDAKDAKYALMEAYSSGSGVPETVFIG